MRPYVLCATILAALLVRGAAPAQQAPTEEQLNQLIARVGDEVITAGDFARELQYRVRQIKGTTGKDIQPDLRFRRMLMNEMISNKILEITAQNSKIDVPDAEVEKEFEDRKSIFDSETAFQSYLDRLGLTVDLLKANIRKRMQVEKYVDAQTGEVTASDEEVQKAYDTLKARGAMTRTEDTRDVAMILMRAKGGTDEAWLEAEERAKAARARVLAGEDFETVAREVSDDPVSNERGGTFREMKKGSFYPEMESALDAMKPGDVSEPVRSVMGWYVMTIQAENKPGTITLDKVHEGLKKDVIGDKRRAAVADIVKEAQLLIRVEIMDAPETPQAPEPDTGLAPAPGAVAPGTPVEN